MSVLDPRVDLDRGDEVLDLLLGLLSSARGVERLLTAQASQPSLLVPAGDDDGFDHLLLGLLSLSGRLQGALGSARLEAAPPSTEAGPGAPRDLLL